MPHQTSCCEQEWAGLNGLLGAACAEELAWCDRELLPKVQEAGSGSVFMLPVWWLRWTHDYVNARMVFGSERAEGKSIYDTVHDLISGKLLPSEFKLKVVFENGKFYSLSNRRLVALMMLQSVRRHEVVKVACTVYRPCDGRICQKYQGSFSTTGELGDGLGLRPMRREAYHMGRPLFRCAEEFAPVESWEQLDTDASSDEDGGPSVARGSGIVQRQEEEEEKEEEEEEEEEERGQRTKQDKGEIVDEKEQEEEEQSTASGEWSERAGELEGGHGGSGQTLAAVGPPPGLHREGYGSDSEGEGSDVDLCCSRESEDEESRVEEMCQPCAEYRPKATLEAELSQQGDISDHLDMKGRLVFGTFMVASGSDFKHRRSRSELLVEEGPPSLLGCRVCVRGAINRNRAWHFDKCWVRIIEANFKGANSNLNFRDLPWHAKLSRCTLKGTVFRAEPSFAPRQKEIVCIRARIVRSLQSMTFRVINGKFPLIKVKWEPTECPPSLQDLHLVEIVKWEDELPQGRYLRRLNIDSTNSDADLKYAIAKSLNYCDWEGVQEPAMFPDLGASVGDRQRRKVAGEVVGIQHGCWPCSMALSISKEGDKSRLEVHLPDVNEYLDALPEAQCKQLEELMRRRAAGVRFADFRGDALEESLPLLPKAVEDATGFRERQEALALTFSFPVDPKTFEVDIGGAKWYESAVACRSVLSHGRVEAALRGRLAQLAPGDRVLISDPNGWDGVEGECTKERRDVGQWAVKGPGGKERSFPRSSLHKIVANNRGDVAEHVELLHQLYEIVLRLEQGSMSKDSSAVFEHLEPDFASGRTSSEREGFASSLLAGCSYLVNRRAGDLLQATGPWASLISSGRRTGEVPMLVASRPDPRSWAAALRLFPVHDGSSPQQVEVRSPNVVKVLQNILGQKGLSYRQRRCLQHAFLKRVLAALPFSTYRLVKSDGSQGADPSAAADFFSREKLFSVASPTMRYLDLLALRALKLKKGWRPDHRELLRPTRQQLEECLERTNLRQDSAKVARVIFRQLTLMRFLEEGSRRVNDCLIGAVGPGSFEILVPMAPTSQAHLSLMVPVNALRGPSCGVSFEVNRDVRLKVTKRALDPTAFRSWTIEPWGSTRLSCLVARNFAQPVQQHATMSAVIVSDMTFKAHSLQGPTEVSLAVGHRMFPEVFSECPDLDKWHLIDSDLDTYINVWHGIRQCQVHASAAAAAPEPERLPVARANSVRWVAERASFAMRVPGLAGGDRVYAGDLCVLHFPASPHEEVTLYGTVDDDPKEEVLVKLSKISSGVKVRQEAVLRKCQEVKVQFIPVLQMEKKSLEKLRNLLDEHPTRSSPILSQLTRALTPNQKEGAAEARPLATKEQVGKALQGPGRNYRALGTELNAEQLTAIQVALKRKFSVVQGPPGTGKTSFLIHLVASLLNLEADLSLKTAPPTRSLRCPDQAESLGKILICAPSNLAADEILDRLIRSTDIPHSFITRVYARCIEAADGCKYRGVRQLDERCTVVVRKDLQEHSLHFKTQNMEKLRKMAQKTQVAYDRSYDRAYEQAEMDVLMQARVVVTTCSSALSHPAWGNDRVANAQQQRPPPPHQQRPAAPAPQGRRGGLKFATVIIDEAAQATELDVVLPALAAQQRVVLVGDQKQLGPVVKEHNLCLAHLQALEKPMLERLSETPHLLPATTMLCTQYRMHSSLRSWISKKYYSSQLQDHVGLGPGAVVKSVWPQQDERITFVDCRTPHEFGSSFCVGKEGPTMAASMQESNTSVKNVGEAEVVVEAFKRLLDSGCEPADIGVLAPYTEQVEEIRTKLKRRVGKQAVDNTSIGTVHTFQGSERRYIIKSFVRSVAEGVAAAFAPEAAAASDVVVSVRADNAALRQTCEANIGIVNNPKALNVSLSRAKEGMVCVGNRHILSEACQDIFEFCEDLASRGCMLSQHEFEELGKL